MGSNAASAGQPSRSIFQAIYPGTNRTVAVGGSSTQSAAFSAGVSVCRFVSSTDCFLAFGQNPTATTSTIFLPAGVIEYFAVNPTDKVAVIQSASSGTLYITEGAPG